MNAIVCVDDSFGMTFNNRRQSRDSTLIKKVTRMSSASRLLTGEFSRSLFDDFAIVDDAFLDIAGDGDFCFVENCELAPYIDKIEDLIVFKWNRTYPYDFSLDIELSDWRLVLSEEFEGSSHERITMEVYNR